MPSLSILVPTHNRSDILLRTLGCVERLVVPEGVQPELVVVANNCSDDTVARSQELIDRLGFPGKVVEEFEPGLNPARNRAMREASGEICVLIDDDIAFEPTWLGEIAGFFAEQPADLAGGRTRLWWEAVERPEWFTPNLDSLLSITDLGDEPVELKNHVGIVGANFWLRKKVWETIGEFRPDLDRSGSSKLGGGESEFIVRALRQGFRAFYSPRGEIQHWVAPERVDAAYLLGVAEGTERGRIRFQPDYTAGRWLYSVVGHAALYGSAFARAARARVSRGADAAMTHRAVMAKARGGLRELFVRAFAKPNPLGKE